ncbi:hypothetical protein [Gluconobacter kanchanaburiensis]|uniref:Uncharacterized protein n=1 Tax=Gluconobacter kanchanaburiensis NBRC 103587 TaxID=1307948 RepID=A0A511B4X1_9PROT|nr:hypothetical protein [Gluconobacter kanchanaburiensis]MBF0861993.1 hypothetical protein [Gluconobacter kanchanaburiensis]GBR67658.1 hypothetical protein AA103587_0399 [Gluconobacter kanchanaburiensis NBRC 103587]GEK95479.1 hypothetical protein GKA01_06760 [Gluconobacter kanchanaburiensis NBRC 103587]
MTPASALRDDWKDSDLLPLQVERSDRLAACFTIRHELSVGVQQLKLAALF